ncbi:MAG TPA: HAD family acid phosphatase [Pyrinomonadaceae bacterium]|nr:HAD family acid phosphatase [Pyrinomonadaceae bacterium]
MAQQRSRPRFIVAAFLLATIFSAQPSFAIQSRSPNAKVPNIYEVRKQLDTYVDSGAYDREIAGLLVPAHRWLQKRAHTATKPAIVLDVDETSLSNWPATRINGWYRLTEGGCDLEKGPCNMRVYQAMARSKAIPATLALAQEARRLGVAVFFISGRPVRLLDATEKNLKEQGYEFAELILRPPDSTSPSVVDFKAPERRKIQEQGYTIILNVGDQQSDLDGGYAERTYKLPNPVYFVK